MKKTIYLFVLIFILPLFVFAVGVVETGETEDIFIIEDLSGSRVELDAIPQRITFVGKASNIVADALYMFPEAGSRIVGVGNTNQRNGDFVEILDPDYSEKTYLAHSAGPEQIAVTRPDLVILKNFHKQKLGASISQLGIPVLYLNLETPEAYEQDLRMLGQVFDNPERAEELVQYYKKEMDYVVQRTQSVSDKPGILFLYHSTRDGIAAFNIPPESWIQTRMISMSGGTPVWIDANPGNGWSKVHLEQIAAWNPDQIYVVAYKEDIGTVLESMKNSTEWQELKAVQNDQLKAFPVDYYSWDQPDSRWILGLKWLAKQVHPDLFTDFDLEQMTRGFYRDLYNLSDQQFDDEIGSRLGW